jgi:hypothetical protein
MWSKIAAAQVLTSMPAPIEAGWSTTANTVP